LYCTILRKCFAVCVHYASDSEWTDVGDVRMLLEAETKIFPVKELNSDKL